METATLIGPYRVLRELGRGGMGVVYLAHDDRLDRQVAIKTLPEELITDEGRLARLKREARVVAQLNHPHIAQIHHLLEDEGALYLVLEYVPGRSLGQRIAAEGALPVEETIRLCRQIAGAVEAAHAHPHFYLEVPRYGGHVGFVAFNGAGAYWSEQRAVAFLGNVVKISSKAIPRK